MFNEQSFDAPVMHVVSESPRLEMLQARLRQAGIRPVAVRGNCLPPDSAPALIDLLTRDIQIQPDDARVLVTIGKQFDAPTKSEIHLNDIAQIATLPARLAIRQREHLRRREIQLRARTSEKFAPSAPEPQTREKPRVLWLGHDAPFLNGIKASLASDDITLVAAISRLTAEDYLISGAFSTIVLCPSSIDDEAANLLKSIKQVPMAQHCQVVLLLRPDLANSFGNDVASADQIVDLSPDLDFVAKRIQSICLTPETTTDASFGLSIAAQDPSTGLVSREYLESHVEAQMAQADRLATSLSLVAVQIPSHADMKHLAQIIRPLLRETDLAARLDQAHICITLPNTQYRGAVVLARRIEEAVDFSVTWRVIERRQFHSLKTLLGGLTAKTSLSPRKSA
ncbi:MAG: diguanylate cyclase [Pseudomonadota bacterium]